MHEVQRWLKGTPKQFPMALTKRSVEVMASARGVSLSHRVPLLTKTPYGPMAVPMFWGCSRIDGFIVLSSET